MYSGIVEFVELIGKNKSTGFEPTMPAVILPDLPQIMKQAQLWHIVTTFKI